MSYTINDIINKYSLPVTRGQESVFNFLEKYYSCFIIDLKESIKQYYLDDVKSDFPQYFYDSFQEKFLSIIESECEKILNILTIDSKEEQIKKLDALMKYLKECGALRELEIFEESFMSRVRKGNDQYDREELFHIRFDQKHLCSAQRFSISESPCLYLSVYPYSVLGMGEMFRLSWLETGMPKTFNACLFRTEKKLSFLHFGKNGYTYLEEYKNAKDEKSKEDRLEALAQYILSFPIRAASFVSVEQKQLQENINDYPEYVFPQLLMEWVRQDDYFVGISYKSASPIIEAKKSEAYNVALPVKEVDPTDGYDVNLKKSFKLSMPEKIDLIEKIKIIEDDIKFVNEYAKELEEKLNISDASERHPYYHLLFICRSLDDIYTGIKMTNDDNIRVWFQQLNTLCNVAVFVNKTIKHAKTADEWVQIHKRYKYDTPLTDNDYIEVLEKFEQVNSTFQKLKSVLYLNSFNAYALQALEYKFIGENN